MTARASPGWTRLDDDPTTGDSEGPGLAVVERICTAHGWGVTAVESETGGARIEVTGIDSLDR